MAPRATGCLLPDGAKRHCRLSPMRQAPRRWWAMPPTARSGVSGCCRRSSTRLAVLMSLIGSAGGMGNSPAAETSDSQWREALDGNLTSAFASVRACLPSLIARRGNVLFVASIASLRRRAAGLRLRHRQTRLNWPDAFRRPRLRPTGVRANAICPGWVTTPMADEEMRPLMEAEGLSLTEAYQRVCRDVPLRRPASPEEIAEACQFLCSPQAAIISGATLVADGGASIVDVPTLAFA
ncbi:SDR family oxidoreductase [Klebsiella variicola subsp. variicola]|nr:SDR family oxidoreductase [Klebsiella variicola subsp. variicola]